MKKAGFDWLLLILLLMALLPLASAEIAISQPKSTYNLGDSFSFNTTIIPSVSTNDFFIASIVCAGSGENESTTSESAEVLRMPQSIDAGAKKTIDVSGKFENFLIGGLRGTCHLKAKFGSNEANSKNFQISSKISVDVYTDKVILNPGERFEITGKAIKENGVGIKSAFLELKSSELDINSFKPLSESDFKFVQEIADNAPAGDYEITARVYEKDSNGGLTNEGADTTRIRINQIIKKASIAVNLQEIKPGEELVYSVVLEDQSGKEASESVDVSIYAPDGSVVSQKLIKSGESNTLLLKTSDMPGNWKIEGKVNELSASKIVYVEELESISYKLANETLIVTNTGNVPYEKSLEIILGGESVVEKIFVDVGETRRYALSAPEGEYSVEVSDGTNKELVGTAFLTGNAIGIEREGAFNFWRKSYLLLWLMLISLGVLLAISQYDKIAKKSYFGKTPSASYAPPIKVAGIAPIANKGDIISEGKREECSIITLSVKNLMEIEKAGGSAADAVERSLTRARDARARIYSDRNYKTMVLAPSITNQKETSLKAVEIAKEIENSLLEHNKRAGERVSFGIGVHNGEMILENINNQLKISPVGSSIPYSKKIADTMSSGLGVSESVHRKLLGKVKSDKIEGTTFWRISKIRDRELHSEFINRFMQRQRSDGLKRK